MSKYHAVPVEIDGVRFASKKEAKRFQDLKLLERAGQIRGLELQPVYPVFINHVEIFKYRGDFQYIENGVKVLEDCKGFKTDIYRLKKRGVEAYYGIKITET